MYDFALKRVTLLCSVADRIGVSFSGQEEKEIEKVKATSPPGGLLIEI